MISRRILATLSLIFVSTSASPSRAQWLADGVPVSTAPGNQVSPQVILNGTGAIVVWQDGRAPSGDIYAQSLNGAGVAQWAANGVSISDPSYGQTWVQAVGDGLGGAFVAYMEGRSSTQCIVVQHINGSGTKLWGNGLTLASSSLISGLDMISDNRISIDGPPGVMVAWQDSHISGDTNIFLQGVLGDGTIRFAAGGIPVTTAPGSQLDVKMTSDGVRNLSGIYGAILTWTDGRSNGGLGPDIYAQRIDAGGVARWTADGAPVCTAPLTQQFPCLTGIGGGSAIIEWMDLRDNTTAVYAQKFGPGEFWAPGGVRVTDNETDPTEYLLMADGMGGAVFAWTDPSGALDVRAQRLNGGGVPRWSPGGILLGDVTGEQERPIVLPGPTGGAIVAWRDAPGPGPGDVRAQSFDSTGTSQWTTPGGARLCTGPDAWPLLLAGVRDGSGGAIVVWEDQRNGNLDLYANHVNGSGGVVAVHDPLPVHFQFGSTVPNPTRSGASWSLHLPEAAPVTIEVLGIDGRLVRVIERDHERPAGRHAIHWDGADSNGRPVPPGVYAVRAAAGAERSSNKVLVLR
jgi:hypothetical protein